MSIANRTLVNGAKPRFHSPLPWLLAFQMMGAAIAGPWYAFLYLSRSPFASGPASSHQARGFLVPPYPTMLLPVSLALGYILPAILMALPSPLTVSNGFQQMALVAWNLFPVILSLVQNLLATSSSMLGLIPVAETPSPEQHLGAVQIAYISGLIVSSTLHVAVISLSAMTVIFPFLYRAEYVRAFSPKAIILPLTSWTPVASLGEGVRSFLLWDQVFAYATMIFLALLQLVRVAPKLAERVGVLRMIVLVLLAIIVAGPGSACILLNWAADESLFYLDSALTDGEARSIISKRKAVT